MMRAFPKTFTVFLILGWLITALSPATGADRLGVVLLHGKTGTLSHIQDLAGALETQGFLVATPEMPWSRKRYLDATYDEGLNEIAAAVQKLKGQGATRVVVAGHSLGANAALAYAATRGGVAGVIMLAPGHVPDLPGWLEHTKVKESLDRAREMVQAGRGAEKADFQDINQGRNFTVATQAQIYLSYFDPEGLGAMGRNAARLDSRIPLLLVIGDRDRLYPKAKDYIFAKAPANPLNRFVVVNADHLGTPAAAKAEVVRWLKTLSN